MITNALSIDVEDYFHVSAFETVSPQKSWSQRESRVIGNTLRLLERLNNKDIRATFFVLGWVAERYPSLIKTIAAANHEIASHGFNHQRVNTQSRQSFREDIRRAKFVLEDLTGQEVIGYRAPSYSISRETYWAFDELYEAGYRYDSSIFPIRHDLYGMADWPRWAGWATRQDDGSWMPVTGHQPGEMSLFEVPITTLNLAGRSLPIAGGGYFRLFPYGFTRYGLKRINRVDKQPFIFYLHPWEIDPNQPRMPGARPKSRLRHYLNLDKTETRLQRLLDDFKFAPICEVFREELAGTPPAATCTCTSA